ncbi:hypothetical protein CHS0354_041576, partial [Potamilus streckersoni]
MGICFDSGLRRIQCPSQARQCLQAFIGTFLLLVEWFALTPDGLAGVVFRSVFPQSLAVKTTLET